MARFAVMLSRAGEQTVTVRYGTASGTASEGTDYDRASGTLTFAPGETEKTISVQTREDALDEPDETFTVTLSNPSGATLEDESATGTITDDDVPSLSITDATAVEGEKARFAVRLDAAGEQTVRVSYGTAGGTATEGTDYSGASGTLTFARGETEKIISVQTRGDETERAGRDVLGSAERPERRDAARRHRHRDDHRRRRAEPLHYGCDGGRG